MPRSALDLVACAARMTVRGTAGVALQPGAATGIGSLPHVDVDAAVRLVLTITPDFPFLPQLPNRAPSESMIRRFAAAPEAAPAELDALVAAVGAMAVRPRAIKLQVTGPLTLGQALGDVDAAVVSCRAWIGCLEDTVRDALPGLETVLFVDEPALVLWRSEPGPLPADEAAAHLRTVLAASRSITGVHVCGAGDLAIACAAGPTIVQLDAARRLDEHDMVHLAAHLDDDGWIAWGAVPTDVPRARAAPGEAPTDPRAVDRLLESLLALWEGTGIPMGRLAERALITPACGLAGHTAAGAEHILASATALGASVAGRTGTIPVR